jgi:predicted DNA-binding protein
MARVFSNHVVGISRRVQETDSFSPNMSKESDRESSPLTFDLKDDLLARLDLLQQQMGAASKSQVIRHAIAVFDYSSFQPQVVGHRQISVRLPRKQKATLLKLSRQKGVSVGELLRVALERLPASPAGLGKKTKIGIVEPMKKATKKAAAKKAAPKKAASKAKKK